MFFRRILPLLSLAAVTLLIWCAITQRWTLEAWSRPIQLHGDPVEIYTRVQAAKEDLSQPLGGYCYLPRLAAPLGADWTRYPISDRVVFTGLGLIARGVGSIAAVTIGMALVHILNALSFYLCARFLRWRPEWAFATAILFTFANFNFRWSVTVSLSLTFFVPPLILLCGWIARSAPAVRPQRWTLLAAALGAWLGGANPYFGFFAAQLVAGAVLLQWFRARERNRIRTGGFYIGGFALSFVAHNAAYFLANTSSQPRLTLDRNYAGSEIYALKLADLIIPHADHPLPFFAEFGRAYQAQSAFRTEFFVNYVGIAGVIGLGVLCWFGVRAVARNSLYRVPDAVLGVAWTLLFSASGGVNSLLALTGLDVFRASNRNSIFILVWALFYFGRWAQRKWHPNHIGLRFAIPALIIVLGLFDAIPRIRAHQSLKSHATTLQSYTELMQSLEARLGSDSPIFQVPTPPFPEAGTTVRMPDYEHFLPYLTSNTLRFSYGALRGTALSQCLEAISRLPAAALTPQLQNLGFEAIWIDRRAFVDDAAQFVLGLRNLGLEELSPPGLPHLTIFLISPSHNPEPMDLTDPRLFEAWDGSRTPGSSDLAIYDGWYALESDAGRSRRWARTSAASGIFAPTAGEVTLSFVAYSLNPGDLVLELNGREMWRAPVSTQNRDRRSVTLNLGAGRHRLTWRFTGKAGYPVGADGRKLGFAIENLELSLPPEAPVPMLK